jgi:hypothetical protein
MRDDHIITLLENTPLAGVSENDLTAIRAHAESCADCLQAFQAAQVSRLLLKERAAVELEPSPFFHTRVLAALRERQTVNDSWAFARMWRAAGALASSMVATVATLAIFTLAIPGTQVASGPQHASSLPNGYSAEEVILNQTSQPEDESDSQVLTVIYGGDEEPAR